MAGPLARAAVFMNPQLPQVEGQLVWSPADPSVGIGVVTAVDGYTVQVQFLRLKEQRAYNVRSGGVLRYQIQKGERVRRKDGTWLRVLRFVGATEDGLLTYMLDDKSEAVESDLVPEVRDVGAKQRLATLSLAHPDAVRARVLGLQLRTLGERYGHAAALGTRVQWLPHQVDIASRAVATDPIRLLLADEVGLGKTVEATMIYAGLRQEGRAERVLILTPEPLCIQWLGEIYRKAHELITLYDAERIDDSLRDFPDLNPFEAYQRIIAPLEMIARDEELSEWASRSEWDLVIVDEAHHLKYQGDDTRSYNLLESVAKNTRNLLLLTATPMALDPAEYHALLRLLDPIRFDDPARFEAVAARVGRIRDVAKALDHAIESHTRLPKEAESEARAIFQNDQEDLDQLERMNEADPTSAEFSAAALDVMQALRARHGLADFVVRNRRGPVGGLPERRPLVVPLEPSEEQDLLIEVGEGIMRDLITALVPAEKQGATLGEWLRALWATPRSLVSILQPYSEDLVRELAPHIEAVLGAPLDDEGLPTGDTRLRWLVQTIRALPPKEKILVFVESPRAVEALHESLAPVLGQDIALFHRRLSPRDQDRQVAWFREASGPRVMLSTEAGGEGRNFQFCHKVVLYDLPWRPATVEQRIGRVDRVGQTQNVEVLVPYYKGGYEAAVLKVMQESIGVLDKTVGGIDHSLEYVSGRLAKLILDQEGVDAWKALYLDTERLIADARRRIEDDVDPILDHASFSPQRAEAVTSRFPDDVESKLESFALRYSGHSRIDMHPKGADLYAVEGAPQAAGGDEDADTGYVGTFSRTYALDHEDTEFLSFGHPTIEQALAWATEADDASAALALCRGFDRDGAIFLWHFVLDIPDDYAELAAYFDAQGITLCLDEGGTPHPEYTSLLLTEERNLEKMDPTPLRASVDRWSKLVEQNFEAAVSLADKKVGSLTDAALRRFDDRWADKRRNLERALARDLVVSGSDAKAKKEQSRTLAAFDAKRDALREATQTVRSRLVAAMAVRLMKASSVSA